MVDPATFVAFSDELTKIANIARVKAVDAAMRHLKGVSGLTTAQRAAMATQAGKGFSTSLPGRLGRVAEAAPESGILTKAHRRAAGKEWGAKAPTAEYTRDVARRNMDLVDPATGKKRGAVGRFLSSWRRGQAAQLPSQVNV